MLRAGDLDRKVELQRFTTTRDEFNSPVEAWATLARVSASKKDVSDAERMQHAEVGAVITTRFQIRWSSTVADLNPKDQLICEGRPYAIQAVKELGRREGLEITAAARAD